MPAERQVADERTLDTGKSNRAPGKRYYYEEEYGQGLTGTMTRTLTTLRRALSLDLERAV
jgi:hypothetical protein